MNEVVVLAKHTFREHVRDRLLHGGVIVCILLLGLSLILGTLTLDEKQRMIFHLGISAIHFLCLALTLFLGSSKIAKEIEKQTCLIVLSRPISRPQYYLGLYLGLLSLLFTLILGLGLFLALLMNFNLSWSVFINILFSIFIEMTVLLALTFLIALYFRPFLAMLISFSVYIIGVWIPDLQFFAVKSTNATFKLFSEVISTVVPHFSRLNLRSYQFLIDGLPVSELHWSYVHSVAWILMSLTLGQIIFRRKDLV